MSDPTKVGLPDELGKPIDDKPIEIEIDYAIIAHFSQHLYSSPNKAVEELVVNSYDAMATDCAVYVKGGPFVSSSVIVWDNGESMGVDELRRLWWIARSPKAKTTRIATKEGVETRSVIGRFGIGKLASFAVGNRLTHLCKRDGRFLRTSVDYRAVPEVKDEKRTVFKTPILVLTEDEARAYVKAVTQAEPAAYGRLWDQPHWTIAVIDALREGPLTDGRLRWVLTCGMPMRPDFKVFLNDELIESRKKRQAFKVWTMATDELQQSLKDRWQKAVKDSEFSGNMGFGSVKVRGKDEPACFFPNLGAVRVTARLFEETLVKDGEERENGFFVMVRERLVNVNDRRYLLKDPSYGTFNRCQFEIDADDLDKSLLADREHFAQASPAYRELEFLHNQLYLLARSTLNAKDDETNTSKTTEWLLPVSDREHFRGPLAALLVSRGSTPVVRLAPTQVKREPASTDAAVARFDPDEALFKINQSHPFMEAVAKELGTGAKAVRAFRAIDLLAISDCLMEGFLFDAGLDAEMIQRTMSWRDELLRLMAAKYATHPSELVQAVQATSYEGDAEFEVAVRDLLRDMGFDAERVGGSGSLDVLVVAPLGKDHRTFTVECKGSKGPKEASKTDIAAAAAHCKVAEAEFAIVVAREFEGFKKGGSEPAVIQFCSCQTPPVTILDVPTLLQLYRSVKSYAWSLDSVVNVLKPLESPAAKLAAVQDLGSPPAKASLKDILEKIWARQQGGAAKDTVPYRTLWQDHFRKDEPDWDKFKLRLQAMETLSEYRLRLDGDNVQLLQKPELILEFMQSKTEA